MNWPLMFRSTHDAVGAVQCATIERMREQNLALNTRALAAEGREEQWLALVVRSQEQSDSWITRYETLLDKFTQLRLVGAIEPPKPIERPEKDKLAAALDAHPAAKSPELRRAMKRQLDMDRVAIDAGVTTEQAVLDQINYGIPTDGVP